LTLPCRRTAVGYEWRWRSPCWPSSTGRPSGKSCSDFRPVNITTGNTHSRRLGPLGPAARRSTKPRAGSSIRTTTRSRASRPTHRPRSAPTDEVFLLHRIIYKYIYIYYMGGYNVRVEGYLFYLNIGIPTIRATT